MESEDLSSENFKMEKSRLKKESLFDDKLEELDLAKGLIRNLDDKMAARNKLADGELDKRLKKADKF